MSSWSGSPGRGAARAATGSRSPRGRCREPGGGVRRRVARRPRGDREEAADALQDALVSAYRRAASFRGEAAVTTWLHRIVVNACLDRVRAAKGRRSDPLPEDLADGG